MAAPAKTYLALSSAQSVAVSTPATSSNTLTATTAFGFGVAGSITNGTTVSTATIVQLQVSGDGTTYWTIDQFPTQTGAGTVTNFSFLMIPDGWSYLRLNYTASAGAGFTATAVVSYCTGFA
jgi:hypothetical protein